MRDFLVERPVDVGNDVRRMKTLLKWLVVLVALFAAAVSVSLLLFGRGPAMDQTVRLSDGTTLRFLDVSVGTNHFYGTGLVRVIHQLPGSWSRGLMAKVPALTGGRSIQTTGNNLVVWLEHLGVPGSNTVHRSALLRPVGGQTGGASEYLGLWRPPAVFASTNHVAFPAWPRRAEMLECVIVERTDDGKMIETGSFEFKNPLRVDSTAWQPERLPATKRAGDLEVELKAFVSGVKNNIRVNAKRDGQDVVTLGAAREGEEPGAYFALEFSSLRDTNETWSAFNVDLGDSTGNTLRARGSVGMTTSMSRTMRFSPTLWSDEEAWNLKLHFKRETGILPEHILTLTNLALPEVGATNRIDQTNVVNGVRMVLRHFIRRPDTTNNVYSSSDRSLIRIEHDDLGETNVLKLMGVTARPSNPTPSSSASSWSDRHYELGFKSFPPGTTHLDLTIAVQPVRFVEFKVAPNRITNDLTLGE